MTRLKIVSNPYQKRVGFQKWNKELENWEDITAQNNAASGLLRERITSGFFPFCMNEIVDEIIEDYSIEGQKIEVVFEGTEGEYKELESLCLNEKYNGKITLAELKRYLINAQEVLPQINDIFKKELQYLILEEAGGADTREELARYSDAASEVIPVCVLGNYSSGKSTFINSLVGREILPGGSKPLTAKVHKIQRSLYPDQSEIRFQYNGTPVKIRIDEASGKISSANMEDAFIQKITELVVVNPEAEDMTRRINRVLELINDGKTEGISSLIEVDVPFHGGLLMNSVNKFVIFDTPGSNSASNQDHAAVLKEAMTGLTNGLLIFVAELERLDGNDNEELYHEIENMKEFDHRFTMIAVNKADETRLNNGGFTEREKKDILRQSIPRNLYSAGIYFVSSVMGLGSKIDGKFEDEHFAEIYAEKKEKFLNKDSQYYKRLYMYNIVPEQMKAREMESAENCRDLIFANSGLFSIEHEIQIFAEKYSAYNKCWQAQLFLGKAIENTSEYIEKKTAELEASKQKKYENLENEKKELIVQLQKKSDEKKEEAIKTYSDSEVEDAYIGEKELKILREEKEVPDFDEFHEKEILETKIIDDAKQVFTKGKGWKPLGESVATYLKKSREHDLKVKEIKDEIEKEEREELLKKITVRFNETVKETYQSFAMASCEYWEKRTEQLRTELLKIIAGSEVLTDENREALEQIVVSYENIQFNHVSGDIFTIDDFTREIKFGNFKLWKSDKIDTYKATRAYNKRMKETCKEIYERIRESHEKSVEDWRKNLLHVIASNIEEYSPQLHEQVLLVKEEEQQLDSLKERKEKIQRYTEQIREMMEWKVLEES